MEAGQTGTQHTQPPGTHRRPRVPRDPFPVVDRGDRDHWPDGHCDADRNVGIRAAERDQLAERTKAGMAAAAEHGRKAGRREVTTEHAKVTRARELKDQGLKPSDIGRVIGASRATVYRYLSLDPPIRFRVRE